MNLKLEAKLADGNIYLLNIYYWDYRNECDEPDEGFYIKSAYRAGKKYSKKNIVGLIDYMKIIDLIRLKIEAEAIDESFSE